MEQRKFIKNISGSVCAIGVVLSTMRGIPIPQD